jgi:hypothetical protein
MTTTPAYITQLVTPAYTTMSTSDISNLVAEGYTFANAGCALRQ